DRARGADMPDTDTTTPSTDPSDLLDLAGLLSETELEIRERVRAFADAKIRPNIADWHENAVFPTEIARDMGDLGLLGMHRDGSAGPGRSAVGYGSAAREIEAADPGLRTFVSVQGSLAMPALRRGGSEEQENRYLPGMAAGELIGCFGLTEPTAGSDP